MAYNGATGAMTAQPRTIATGGGTLAPVLMGGSRRLEQGPYIRGFRRLHALSLAKAGIQRPMTAIAIHALLADAP